MLPFLPVTPAKAGVHAGPTMVPRPWIPAFAGMTNFAGADFSGLPQPALYRVP
jgi:hypothetical protein